MTFADGVAWSYKEATGDFEYKVAGKGGRRSLVRLPEKRVVTYSPRLARKQKYEVNRLVEKARALRLAAARRSEYGDSARFVTFAPVDGKDEVRDDARPVYLQRRSTITGHLLVCYLAVLLFRLLQVKVLGDRFSSEDVMGLCRGFNVC